MVHRTSAVLVTLLAGAALVCGSAGHFRDLGFEEPGQWMGPWGFGTLGGSGSGSVVSRADGGRVRSGEYALRLAVEDDGSPAAVAWAGASHFSPCEGGSRVKAGAWFHVDPDAFPPTEGRALAQLRMEYFEDRDGRQLIPTHVSLSTPFTSREEEPSDTWNLVELYDRAPGKAQSVKLSILLLSQKPNGQKKQVWVDDPFLEFQHRHRRASTSD